MLVGDKESAGLLPKQMLFSLAGHACIVLFLALYFVLLCIATCRLLHQSNKHHLERKKNTCMIYRIIIEQAKKMRRRQIKDY